MPAGFSSYLENKLTDLVLRAQAFSGPATFYAGLLTCTNGIVARSTTYATNNSVVVLAADGLYHLYLVTTGGQTAASAPAYPGYANETITDGAATLKEQQSNLSQGLSPFVEVSGGSYARVAVTASLANWSGTQGAGTTTASSGTGGQSSNNAAITFPTSTAAWAAAPVMVWGIGIWDASSGGNELFWGALTTPQNIGTGNTPSFSAAQLTATFN